MQRRQLKIHEYCICNISTLQLLPCPPTVFQIHEEGGVREREKRVCMSPGTERIPILQPHAEAPRLPGGSRLHPGASVPGQLTQWNAQLWKSSHFFTVKHANSCWHHTPKYNNFCHLETLSVLLPTNFSFFAVISSQKQCQWIKWTAWQRCLQKKEMGFSGKWHREAKVKPDQKEEKGKGLGANWVSLLPNTWMKTSYLESMVKVSVYRN